MPWCDHCAKFWNPSSMTPSGECPTCGRVLDAPKAPVSQPLEDGPPPVDSKNLNLKELAGENGRAPWHFKLLLILVAAYLLWRIVQLVGIIF